MHYLEPLLALVIVALAAGTWSAFSGRRPHRRLLAGGVACLFLLTWPPPAWLITAALEAPYYTRGFPRGSPDAIVVVSAGLVPSGPGGAPALPNSATYIRTMHAAWLYQHWRQVPVLVSGGHPSDSPRMRPLALAMRDLLLSQGIPARDIWIEELSQSTYENALFGGQVLRAHGVHTIAAVTEAYHMPRTVRVFAAQGFTVLPAPCGFRRPESGVAALLPSARAVEWVENALHEVLALAWYKMRGWI